MKAVMRYHGGKFRLARWIVSHFPEHRIYVEPFAGAGSVLMHKPRSYGEIYNDLDGQVVNVFRVLRDGDLAQRLVELVHLTPFSRVEFELSYQPAEDPVEQARRTIFRSFSAHGSTGVLGERTGFRAKNTTTRKTDAKSWANYPSAITEFTERLRGVVIENRSAVEVMEQHDGPDTLHYLDPPYVWNTRSAGRAGRAYRHEMSNDDHQELAEVLHRLQGHIVLSGYPSEFYNDLYRGWDYHEREARAAGGEPRTESVWIRSAMTAPVVRRVGRQLNLSLTEETP